MPYPVNGDRGWGFQKIQILSYVLILWPLEHDYDAIPHEVVGVTGALLYQAKPSSTKTVSGPSTIRSNYLEITCFSAPNELILTQIIALDYLKMHKYQLCLTELHNE